MRSWLFTPATGGERLKKAFRSAADAVIVDREDAVAFSEKDSARAAAGTCLAELDGKRPAVYLRVNEQGSPWYRADMEMAVRSGFDGVMLPKSHSGDDIQRAEELLRSLGAGPETFALVPLIESAAGVVHAEEIAEAGAFVRQLAFGSLDFLLDLGGRSTDTGAELLYARSKLALASRAAGKEGPVDAVFPDFRNDEGLRADTLLSRALGFQGKLLIHPRQIPVVNEAFAPSGEEIQLALEITEAFRAAEAEGKGAIQVRGKMVDQPVYRKNQQLLEQARLFGLLAEEAK